MKDLESSEALKKGGLGNERSLKVSFTLFFALFVFAIFSVIIYTSLQQIDDAASVIASRLGYPIVKRAAAFIDGDAFENLTRTLDANDPFYDEIRLKLLALKEETQVLYLYTMAPYTKTVHRFIIDGGRPGEEGFSAIGADEDITDYTLAYMRTFETKTMQSGEMNLQSTWGWVISAYMPILNSAGDMVGIIGVDFEAESVYQVVYSRICQQLIIVVVFIVIGFIMYFYLLKAITRQNQKLIDMNRAFQSASESKSVFLARMSHEIRTPMNAIIGMNELAIRDYGRPETMEYLRDIRQAGATLLSIINDILDFSKIESGHIQITAARYDTASLLNDALAIIRIRLGDKPIELLADIDPSIPAFMTGDEIRVRQILLNILSNAVKYTNEGFIKFTARCDIIGDEAVDLIFSVEDSGIGIRREDIGRLFGDFSRVDLGRNKNIQGSGLGLSITRLICRAMGGDVTVTSEYGQGSVFTATIRQKCADYVPMGGIEGKISYRAEVGAIRFTAPDFRVLIADDNAANLKVAAGLLAPYKMKVDTCLSGEESVALVKENNYDLVFMDHMMPGMDGIEATKAIRALGGRFDELQIVALTANAISGMKEMFLENGFNDFLSKPIEIPKLDELIERRVPLERRHKAKAITKGVADAEFIGIEGLDTAKGMAMTGGNCANYRSVLELYCRDAESRMGFLELAHAERDLKNFTTQVHALKSASASIGATAVSQEAASLEDAGRRGDMDAIREHAEEFRENLAALIARILSVIRPEVSGDVQTIGEEVITRLASALSAEDVGAADKIMAELSLAPLDSASSRVISEISDLLLISEFEEALGRLKEFK